MLLAAVDKVSLASLSGWLSIGFWIMVQVAQIYENYRLGSGEGLSVFFVFIWLAGDSSNLLGAFWQGLLPTVTYLAAYYVFCDVVLLAQVAYYRRKRRLHPEEYLDPSILVPSSVDAEDTEDATESTALLATESKIHLAARTSKYRDLFVFIGACTLVLAIGFTGWGITQRSKRGRVRIPEDDGLPAEVWDDQAQIVGWISAVLYLCSRFPQIVKNIHTKCEGLSLLFFFFALCGNLTFCASILIVSLELEHIMVNLAWLVGSGGTILTDMIVISQFVYYAKDRRRARESIDASVVAGLGKSP